MTKLEIIHQYNEGIDYPETYTETYIATKHIQSYDLEIPATILVDLKKKLEEKNFFFNDENVLSNIITGLIKGNIILQGPPGTGKTTIAEYLSEIFNVSAEIVTATSDWTTYDTIGGYQPDVDMNGNERFTGKNGRVVESILKCCGQIVQKEKYSMKEDFGKQAHWLIIDELNRSEIDKVFGDLFTVFGSDDYDKCKISLWFHSDNNKKLVYVPNRFRIIGVINNIDKNFVFNISQGLSRRFTFITINPPKENYFENEIKNIRESIIINKVSKKLKSYGSSTSVSKDVISEILNTPKFLEVESHLKDLLKRIRYYLENNNGWLGLQIGTAQIIDIYETTVISLILRSFAEKNSEEQERLCLQTFDSSIRSKIVPQMEGFYYDRLQSFLNFLEKDNNLKKFEDTIIGIKVLLS